MKTYITQHGNLSTVVKLKERTLRIRFVSKDNIIGHYATANPEIQHAIENDRDYGIKFSLAHEYSPRKKAKTDLRPLPEIDSWQKARGLLLGKPYLVPQEKLSTPAKIISAAKNHGIFFPALAE